MISSTVTTIA